MICLDTSFLIDFLKEDAAAIEKAASIKQEIIVTTRINIFELLHGEFARKEIKQKRISELYDFLKQIKILELDNESAIRSAEIAGNLTKQGKPIGQLDSLIAGISLTNGVASIITRNVKDFSKIKGLKVETY